MLVQALYLCVDHFSGDDRFDVPEYFVNLKDVEVVAATVTFIKLSLIFIQLEEHFLVLADDLCDVVVFLDVFSAVYAEFGVSLIC